MFVVIQRKTAEVTNYPINLRIKRNWTPVAGPPLVTNRCLTCDRAREAAGDPVRHRDPAPTKKTNFFMHPMRGRVTE